MIHQESDLVPLFRSEFALVEYLLAIWHPLYSDPCYKWLLNWLKLESNQCFSIYVNLEVGVGGSSILNEIHLFLSLTNLSNGICWSVSFGITINNLFLTAKIVVDHRCAIIIRWVSSQLPQHGNDFMTSNVIWITSYGLSGMDSVSCKRAVSYS